LALRHGRLKEESGGEGLTITVFEGALYGDKEKQERNKTATQERCPKAPRTSRTTAEAAFDFKWASGCDHYWTARRKRSPDHVGRPGAGRRRVLDQERQGDSEDQIHLPTGHQRLPLFSDGPFPQGMETLAAASRCERYRNHLGWHLHHEGLVDKKWRAFRRNPSGTRYRRHFRRMAVVGSVWFRELGGQAGRYQESTTLQDLSDAHTLVNSFHNGKQSAKKCQKGEMLNIPLYICPRKAKNPNRK
jgi:hypothetical protein